MMPNRSSFLTLAVCCFASRSVLAQGTPPPTAPAPAAAAPSPAAAAPGAPTAAPSSGPGAAPAAAPAQPPPDEAIFVAQPPLPPLEPRSRHYHDGFYLRLSLGFGALGVSSSSDKNGTGTASGSGGAIDLLAGGTPAPGLVIGGGLLLQEAFDPSYKSSLPGATPNQSAIGFGMLGPMIDAFPNPNGGFHVGGLLGLSRMGLKDAQGNLSSGLGLSAWAGYMWWASSDWSLGGLVRLSAAWSGRTVGPDQAQYDVNDTTRAVTFMFSTAYH